MAHKSAVAKQQDTSQRPGNAAQAPPAPLTAPANAFNLAVAQCVQDTDPDAVHRLRTGSRRLQAMLEATLREAPRGALEQPARAWLRQLKHLRRAAGPVRDLDVHRKLLEDWVGKEPPTSEKEKLDAWLKEERKR